MYTNKDSFNATKSMSSNIINKTNLVGSFKTVIQSISSCPLLVWRINQIFDNNRELYKLNLLHNLLTMVIDDCEEQLTPAQNTLFNKWNSADENGTFDCMTKILNEIFDEIRQTKSIFAINSWLKYRLPLRIVMHYEIFCDCGYKEMSPGQSELSITLMSTYSTSLQKLINKYFEEEHIDGKVCTTIECSTGKQKRKLSCPLTETLCVIINRQPLSKKVSFDAEIIISRKYCIVDPKRDITYNLTCVLNNLYNLCYKRMKDDWYLITDDMSNVVDISEVYSCQPYILFFEIKDLVTVTRNIDDDIMIRMPMSLVDYCLNNWLHSVIQALSSCQSFVAWLKDSYNDITTPVTKIILQLINISCNNSDDDVVDINVIKTINAYTSSDIYHLLQKIFTEIIKDSNSKESENVIENIPQSPWSFFLSTVQMCGCGSKILINTNMFMSLNITIVTENIQEDDDIICLQELVDLYFQEVDDKENNCVNRLCAVNNVSKRCIMNYPIPTIICVHLYNPIKSNLQLKKELVIKEEFFSVNDRKNKKSISNESRLFYLKSALLSDGGQCYKLINNQWFHIEDKNFGVINLDEIVLSDTVVLLYESADYIDKPWSEFNDGSMTKGSECIKNVGSFVNIIIQSLSSCFRFIEWLTYLPTNDEMVEIRTLSSLINIVNHILESDNNVDSDVLQCWYEDGSNSYEALNVILNGILNDLTKESENIMVTPPIMIYNYCTKSNDEYESKLVKNIVLPDLSNCVMEQNTVQELLDQCFEIWSGFNELHIKFAKTDFKMSLKEGLTDTLGFHFEDSCIDVVPSMFIILKNKSCIKYKSCQLNYEDCCRKYVLRSVIDKDGLCYKVINERFYKLNDSVYTNVDDEDVLILRPRLILYE